MPRKYVSRRSRLRRKSGRKGYRRRTRRIKGRVPQTLIQRAPTGHPFPQRYVTKLRYVSDAITVTTGTSYDRIFRGNGCFDPDATGAGHQPMGFDQLAGIYSRYRVLGAKITMRVVPVDATAGRQNMYFGVIPQISPTSYNGAVYSQLREQPYAKFNYRTLYQGPTTIKKYMTGAQIEGVKKAVILADAEYTADVTALPQSQWYWHCIMGTMDGTSLINATMYCEIDYYVAFEGRIQLSQS